MGELKACPFCRGKARVIQESDPDLIQYKVMCQNCGVSTPFIGSREQSEDTWNRRVAPESDNAQLYLKAYQNLLQKAENLNETLLKKLKTSSPENKPLTLDELRNIDKEKVPVWIAEKGSPNHGEYWQYAYDFNSDMMAFFTFGNECEEFYSAKDYGKTWLAYARKPEGSEKA